MHEQIAIAFMGVRGRPDMWLAFAADLHGMQSVPGDGRLLFRMDEKTWRIQVDPKRVPGLDLSASNGKTGRSSMRCSNASGAEAALSTKIPTWRRLPASRRSRGVHRRSRYHGDADQGKGCGRTRHRGNHPTCQCPVQCDRRTRARFPPDNRPIYRAAARHGVTVFGTVALNPGSTSTEWPSPRGAVNSIGAVKNSAVNSPNARTGSSQASGNSAGTTAEWPGRGDVNSYVMLRQRTVRGLFPSYHGFGANLAPIIHACPFGRFVLREA